MTSVDKGSQADIKGVEPGMQIFDIHAATALLPVNEKASKAFNEREIEAVRKLVRARQRLAAIKGTRRMLHKSTSTTLAEMRAEEKKERDDGDTSDEESAVQLELRERRLFRNFQRVHRIEDVFWVEFMNTRSRRASEHEIELSGSTREINIAVNDGVEFSLADKTSTHKSVELTGAKIIKTRTGHRGSHSADVEMQSVHVRREHSDAKDGYDRKRLPRRASPTNISDMEMPREARQGASPRNTPAGAAVGPSESDRELSVMLDSSVAESGNGLLWGTSIVTSRPKSQATPRINQTQTGRAFQTTVVEEADSATLQDEQQRAVPAPKRGRTDREMSVLLDSVRSSSGGDILWGVSHVVARSSIGSSTGATSAISPRTQLARVQEAKASKEAKSSSVKQI